MELFTLNQFGKSKNVTAQDRVNCYFELQPSGDRSKIAIYGTPGLDLFTPFGDTPARGLYQRGDFLYEVHRGTFYEVNNAAVKTAKGTINTTSGRVYMADNGFQLLLTDGIDGWIYTFEAPTIQTIASITSVSTLCTLTTALPHGLKTGMTVTIAGAVDTDYNGTFVITVTGTTTFEYTALVAPTGAASVVGTYTVSQFSQITDEYYPNAATVTWQDGYFIVNPPNTQKFYISAINNGYEWNALDFASAESNPDDIVSVNSDNGNLYLFGDYSTEFWTNTGNLDFPFDRISGGAIEWGCAAVNTICKYDNSLAFLARNIMGQVIVAKMQGYLPVRLSNPELEHIINNYSAVSDATAFTYMLGGHPMLQINFPTGDASWLYDGLTNLWSKVKGFNINRHRAEIGVNYLDKIIVSDYLNGNLYRLNPDSYDDNGEPNEFEVISRHIDDNNLRLTVDQIELDIEAGVGLATGQGSNPQIMMSVSKDGGHTYGTEQWVTMGAIGDYKARAVWRKQGQSRDWTFKFRITDPVKRVIFGSSLKVRKGSS
jgi:hypothetical protein